MQQRIGEQLGAAGHRIELAAQRPQQWQLFRVLAQRVEVELAGQQMVAQLQHADQHLPVGAHQRQVGQHVAARQPDQATQLFVQVTDALDQPPGQ